MNIDFDTIVVDDKRENDISNADWMRKVNRDATFENCPTINSHTRVEFTELGYGQEEAGTPW